jgi:hypothetical protein
MLSSSWSTTSAKPRAADLMPRELIQYPKGTDPIPQGN